MRPQSHSGSVAPRSPSPGPYVPQPESLILPDGAVSEGAAELLEDLVHPHNEIVDHDAEYRLRKAHHKDLPWWKTPSPWWLLIIVPFTAVAMSATLAPRIEVYTLLACSVHKPDIFRQTRPAPGGFFSFPETSPIIPPRIPKNEFSPLGLNAGHGYTLPAPGLQNDTDKKPDTCASDPVVQAAVAKLSAVITSSMGILSCLTGGWWGAFSDRHGRTRLLGISVIGVLVTDFNFIFVSRNFRHLPGGYWFLIVGPLIDGAVGGLTSSVAASHAYISDTTTEATRSRVFSLSLGLFFTGMAFGPALGGLLIHFTGQVLSVFYAAAFMHLIYAALIWFVLPESLLQSQMQRSKIKYDEDLRDTARDRESNPAVGLLVRGKRLFAFLSPLTVFLPELKAGRLGDNPLKRNKRDWNLTIIAAVYGLAVSVMGSYTYKFQFAASNFSWTSETLGYFLTLSGAGRAVFLTLILPIIIKLFKPTPNRRENPTELGVDEEQPLLHPRIPSSQSVDAKSITRKMVARELHSSSFDLGIARASLSVEVIAYTCMAMAPTALLFTVSTLVSSMGAGFGPAIQSVALAMYRQRGGTESGRLFGALSVVQALSSQIIGPAVYGLVYMKTVATYPRAIFILSSATVGVSFALLTLVRLPKDTRSRPESGSLLLPEDVEDEETRIGSERGESMLGDGSGNESGNTVKPSASSSRR